MRYIISKEFCNSLGEVKIGYLIIISQIGVLIIIISLLISEDLFGLFGCRFNNELVVDFINVGQGDAIYIKTPKGRNYLVDGGMNVSYEEAKRLNIELVYMYLKKKKIRHINGIVITHAHNDHLSGLLPVIKYFKVEKIWETGINPKTPIYKEFTKICERKRLLRCNVKAGDLLDWGDELFVQVLHPELNKMNLVDELDQNNMSITLMIRYGMVTLILTGDIEEKAQIQISKYGYLLKADIIKVPNHGDDSSLFKPFLDFIKPKYGIIQVGKYNPFNYPSNKTLELYERLGIKLYRNDIHGNISLHIKGATKDDFYFVVDHKK